MIRIEQIIGPGVALRNPPDFCSNDSWKVCHRYFSLALLKFIVHWRVLLASWVDNIDGIYSSTFNFVLTKFIVANNAFLVLL